MSNNTITKGDLTEGIGRSFQLKASEAKLATEAFIDTFKQLLREHKSVRIMGLGLLKMNYKNQRMGRNPKNKKDALISSRYTVTFRTSSSNYRKDVTFEKVSRSKFIERYSDILEECIAKEFTSNNKSVSAPLNRIKKDFLISVYNIFVRTLEDIKENGGRLEIRGLGTFTQNILPPRNSRNLLTGETFISPESRRISFKCSKNLFKEINDQ